MPFTFFEPKHRRNPNEKVQSMYRGIAPGGKVVTRLEKPSHDGNRMEVIRTYEDAPIERGQGGMVGNLIIGGMETTLDEVEDILAAKKEKKWEPRRNNNEIGDMCRFLMEQRNDLIKYYRKNPSEAPKAPPQKNTLFLPVGVRWHDTAIPGLRIAERV